MGDEWGGLHGALSRPFPWAQQKLESHGRPKTSGLKEWSGCARAVIGDFKQRPDERTGEVGLVEY